VPWVLFVEYTLLLVVLVIIFKGCDKLVDFAKTKKNFVFAEPKTEALWSFAVTGAMFILTLIFCRLCPQTGCRCSTLWPGAGISFGQAFDVGLVFLPL